MSAMDPDRRRARITIFMSLVLAATLIGVIPPYALRGITPAQQLAAVSAPAAASINPSSAPAGANITITGSGFDAADNTVSFSQDGHSVLDLSPVPSSNYGTSISFNTPSLPPGNYLVTIAALGSPPSSGLAFTVAPTTAPSGGANCLPAEGGQRVEVPITQWIDNYYGIVTYSIPIKIGNSGPLDALLDTGSGAIQVISSVVSVSDYASGGTPFTREYGVEGNYAIDTGITADATVSIGSLSARLPVHVVTKECLRETIDGPDKECFSGDTLAQKGIRQVPYGSGEWYGIPGIIGIGLMENPDQNGLAAMGGGQWIVELPPPDGVSVGKLIINPSSADIAGYVLTQLSTQEYGGAQGAPQAWNDQIQGCITNTSGYSFCHPHALIDTGSWDVMGIVPNLADNGPSWPSGTHAELTFHNGAIRYPFVVGEIVSSKVFPDTLRTDTVHMLIGPLPLFKYWGLYDAGRGVLGLALPADVESGAACSGDTASESNESTAPTITSVTVSGTQITITGTGFSSTNNTVYIGGTSVTGISSADGTTLVFTQPSGIASGSYEVSVSTSQGTSLTTTTSLPDTTGTGSTGGTGGSSGGSGSGSDSTGSGGSSGTTNTGSSMTILGGTVPCSGWDCTLCTGVSVMQLVINFAIVLAMIISAGLFAWGGALMMVSAGNMERRKKAISIFKSVGIGFLSVLFCWIIVDTIMRVVISNPDYLAPVGGKWYSVGSCEASDKARQTTKLVSELLYGVFVPGTPTYTSVDGVSCPSGSTPVGNGCMAGTGGAGYVPPVGYSCSTGEFDSNTGGCKVCDEGGCSIIAMTPPAGSIGGGTVTNPQMASQLSTSCTTYSVDCAIANGIGMAESEGGKNCTTNPKSGAVGCMQVLATTACDIQASISSSCSACLSSKNSISSACAPVRTTVETNTQLGVDLGVKYISQLQSMSSLQSLITQYGKCQVVAASYFQGAGTVISAGGIPSNAQNYVKKACG